MYRLECLEPVRRCVFVVLAFTLLAGCSDPKIGSYTALLQQDSLGSTEKLRNFYSGLKETNRQMYLSESKAQRLAKTEIDPALPGPSNPFDDEKIQHRVEAAEDLESVCSQLDQMVSSKNIQQANQAITIIGEKLQGLSQLANTPIPGLNKLISLGSPITALLKLAVHGGFEIYVDRWICQNVTSIDTAFGVNCTAISALIAKDAGNTKLRASTLIGRWQEANQKVANISAAQGDRVLVSNELEKATKWEQEADLNTPKPIFDKMRKDFHDLCEYARKKIPPQAGGGP